MMIEINNIVTVPNLFYFSLMIMLVTFFLWYSKKFVCCIITGILIFLWLPYVIDFLIIGRIETNVTNIDTWLGFIGSYLGSGLGAGVTLVGVFYQLSYTKKMEEKNRLSGFMSYINYSLKNISLNKIVFEKIEENNFFERNKKSFYEISEVFLQENIKLLFSIEKIEAEKVLKFFSEVFNYNKKCFLFSKDKTIDVLLNEFRDILVSVEKQTFVTKELFQGYLKTSSVLTMLNMIYSYKWLLETDESLLKEKIEKNFNELIEEIIKYMKEIQNLKYIKARKTFIFKTLPIKGKDISIFILILDNLKNYASEKDKTEEKIFFEINEFQILLINALITKEEYKSLDNDIFIKLDEKKNQLLKRIKLEKEIIDDKKRILSLAPDLIKDLEKYIK